MCSLRGPLGGKIKPHRAPRCGRVKYKVMGRVQGVQWPGPQRAPGFGQAMPPLSPLSGINFCPVCQPLPRSSPTFAPAVAATQPVLLLWRAQFRSPPPGSLPDWAPVLPASPLEVGLLPCSLRSLIQLVRKETGGALISGLVCRQGCGCPQSWGIQVSEQILPWWGMVSGPAVPMG